MTTLPRAAADRGPRLLAVLGLVLCAALAGCASTDDDESSFAFPKLADLNPFGTAKQPLPGKRVSLLTTEDQLSSRMETASVPVAIPEPIANSDWSMPGGNLANAPGHLALAGSLGTAWSVSAGTGSGSGGKLTATPIVHQGRIYVLDAAGTVRAFSTGGGSQAWSTSLAPESESDSASFGGGLAADGDRLYAVTGYGTAVALDAGSGSKLWEKSLGAPSRSAPIVADGRLFATTTEGQVFCLSISDGTPFWVYRGVPQQTAGLLTNVNPAADGGTVVVPFTSGDLVALNAATGEPLWAESLNGARASASLAALSDPSSPVIDGGTVFAVSRGGRMIASSETTGERLWSLQLSSVETPWVAGDAVYVVDLIGRLVAINRTTGEIRWASKLPGEKVKAWSGPLLAGGRLWVASNKGKLVSVDPSTGKVVAEKDLGAKVLIAPIVAGGRMYVLTDSAYLMALN